MAEIVYIFDGHKAVSIEKCSKITKSLIFNLIERDKLGQKKYGTSLDRADLTKNQWLDHMTEEMLDAAGYAQAAKNSE